MVKLRLENLCKYFGNVKAVDDISLSLSDGEFFALLGPSGCGKSTVLLTIAGIYRPTSGRIYFDDKVVNDLPIRDRNVGMVFQSYALYPHMKVFDNVAFPLRLKKMSSEDIRKKVERITKFVGVADLLSRKPAELSGGQQQRVALARALVKEPNLFLLDEPLSNLDAKLRVTMRAELKKLQKDLGITTIYVSHDQVEAMTMADRVGVIDRGRFMQVGSADDLYNEPENLFVAGFIGSPPMNLIDCSVTVDEQERVLLDAGDFKLAITGATADLLREESSAEVVLGVRPEDVTIQPSRSLGSIRAEIYVIEPLGREILVDLRAGNIPIRALTRVLNAKMKDEVWVAFDPEKLHVFDKRTGKVVV